MAPNTAFVALLSSLLVGGAAAELSFTPSVYMVDADGIEWCPTLTMTDDGYDCNPLRARPCSGELDSQFEWVDDDTAPNIVSKHFKGGTITRAGEWVEDQCGTPLEEGSEEKGGCIGSLVELEFFIQEGADIVVSTCGERNQNQRMKFTQSGKMYVGQFCMGMNATISAADGARAMTLFDCEDTDNLLTWTVDPVPALFWEDDGPRPDVVPPTIWEEVTPMYDMSNTTNTTNSTMDMDMDMDMEGDMEEESISKAGEERLLSGINEVV